MSNTEKEHAGYSMEVLQMFIFGSQLLSPKVKKRLEKHISTCVACQERCNQLAPISMYTVRDALVSF